MKCLRKERDALLKEKEDWKREKTTHLELLDKKCKEINDASEMSCFPTFHFTRQCHFNWKACERVVRR